MADAAKAAGQVVTPIPEPITSQGVALSGSRANLPPKVMQTAFTIPAATESEVIDLGQGEFWVVHVDKLLPPALVGLDEKVGPNAVRDIVTRQFQVRTLMTTLRSKADALVAKIGKGTSLEAAAAEVGAKVEQASNITQAAARPVAPGQPPANSQQLIGQLFTGKPGDVVIAQDNRPALIVARIGKVQEAPAAELAGVAEAARLQATSALVNDLGQATRLAAERMIKPVIDYRKAQQALGLDPDAIAKKPAK